MNKTAGVIALVMGIMIGLWSYARVTSLAGQFCTWAPPLSPYESITMVGGVIAAVLVILGLISITKSPG